MNKESGYRYLLFLQPYLFFISYTPLPTFGIIFCYIEYSELDYTTKEKNDIYRKMTQQTTRRKKYIKRGLYTIQKKNYIEKDYTKKEIIKKEDQTGKNYIKRDYIKETTLHKEKTTQRKTIYKRLYYTKKRLYKKKTIQGKTTQGKTTQRETIQKRVYII